MRSALMVATCVLGLLAVGGLLATPLRAGEARVLEGAGPDRVVVETSDASVDEVLAALASHFEFAVERRAPAGQAVRVSGRIQGTLDEVLERLLRHEGHMVVRSAEARAGISRVLILEAKGGVSAPAVAGSVPSIAGPIAAIKARLQAREGDEAGR